MSILIPIFIAVVVLILRQSAKLATKEQSKGSRTFKAKESNVEPVLIKEDRMQETLTEPYQQGKESVNVPQSTKVKKSALSYQKKRQTGIMTERRNLVQGFMFSEVLGKPRAKNPHPAMMRYHQKSK